MSMAVGDTASGSAHPDPSGRGRGACDRCRGQKLRCIPVSQSQDPSETRCVRCTRAGAICITGVSGRAGRPRMSQSSYLEEHGGRGNRRRPRNKIISRIAFNAYGNRARVDSNTNGLQKVIEGDTMDSESGYNTEDRTPVHTTSSLPVHDTSAFSGSVNSDFPALFWSDELLPPFFNGDSEETLDIIPRDLGNSWAFHDYQTQPMVIQTLTASPNHNDGRLGGPSGDVGVDTCGTPTQRCPVDEHISGAPEKVMDIDAPNDNAPRAPLNSISVSSPRPPRASDQNREQAEASLSSVMGSTADLALSMNVAREMTESIFKETSFSDIQHQRMQKLSEFAVDLYEQELSINSDNCQPVSVVSATALWDQLVGSVLKSSIAFSTLLDSFSASSISSLGSSTSSPTNLATSINRNKPNSSSSDSGTSLSASALRSERSALNSNGSLSTSYSDDSNSPPPIDITIILQLVICYIRIVHLHSVMYSRILDYLITFPPYPALHVGRVLPVFPGMQVGGVSLDKFGMFQIKLLVQISVHVLGGIETTLGLPERHMVGKRKNGGIGLFQSNVSGNFVECLMREKAWSSQNVECVRKHLRELGEVLEGAI